MHETPRAPAAGTQVLLWPPVVGPAGVLLRHALVVDAGLRRRTAEQAPWLVRPDLSVVRLPFALAVAPLAALPDGRWLTPGVDAVWRDDHDEPLGLLAADGTIEPLLVAGAPVRASRVLREAAPELLHALEPVGDGQDVPWAPVAARLGTGGDELFLAITVREGPTDRVLVAAPSLGGFVPGAP